MLRNSHRPQYIKAETICIGDTIRVTYPPTNFNDIERSYVGTVASRERRPPFQTAYISERGNTIFVHLIGEKPEYRITLLERHSLSDLQPTLDGIQA